MQKSIYTSLALETRSSAAIFVNHLDCSNEGVISLGPFCWQQKVFSACCYRNQPVGNTYNNEKKLIQGEFDDMQGQHGNSKDEFVPVSVQILTSSRDLVKPFVAVHNCVEISIFLLQQKSDIAWFLQKYLLYLRTPPLLLRNTQNCHSAEP